MVFVFWPVALVGRIQPVFVQLHIPRKRHCSGPTRMDRKHNVTILDPYVGQYLDH